MFLFCTKPICLPQVVQRRVRRWTGQAVPATSIVSDFELSILIAVNTEMPNAHVCPCYFHFCQSLWRRVLNVGLASAYREHASVRKLIRKIMAVAFLPLPVLRNNVQLLVHSREWRTACRRFPAILAFFRYFDRVYMNDGGQFPPRLWNVYNRSVNTRTNNYMEGMKQ